MLCRLLDVTWPLATLQLARENGVISNWVPAELELAHLVGLEAFKKRVKREIFLVKNLPKKVCDYCGGTIIVFSTLSQIAKNLLRTGHKAWVMNCQECGHKFAFTNKDIPIKLLTIVRKRLAATNKRRKIRKKQVVLQENWPEAEIITPLPFPSLEEILAHNVPPPPQNHPE